VNFSNVNFSTGKLHIVEDDHFHDKCAVVGVINNPEASNVCYLGLYALQHRGQEGAGIASEEKSASGESFIRIVKDEGLVADIFSADALAKLPGTLAIGHTRYATFGGKDWQNIQPLVANSRGSSFAVAHNGNIINAGELRAQLEATGSLFSTSSDTEVILHLVAKESSNKDFLERLKLALSAVQGAYSVVILSEGKLYAARDAHGVRPLSLAKLGQGFMVASETCAFDLVGAEFVRDILPGEIVEISSGNNEIKSVSLDSKKATAASCIFEQIYFARPDSVIAGRNVYSTRKQLGAELALESPANVDLVIPVPDSGVPAAIGYGLKLNIPVEFGLIRNHYVGRTFIEPKQSIRDFGVKIKLNANRTILQGKRVAVIDDSIVRGTTCKKIIKIIRDAGAKEVHFRVSSPPTTGPCHYGIDTPSYEELIANNHSVEQIREFIGADSLSYLSIDGMYRALDSARTMTRAKAGFCDACFSGDYFLGLPSVVKKKT
jgi:amidophosphoribosyltransferase